MTSKERISRILKRQPVDRIGVFEHFWNETHNDYLQRGFIKDGESFEEHFDLDISLFWAFNLAIDQDYEPETVCEDEDTITVKDGNGAILRRHKYNDGAPEHVDFTITNYDGWKQVKAKLLENPESRINFEAYRNAKTAAAKAERFFAWCGINVFECMHPVCGHEHMLVGMALEPEWIEDMSETYAELTIKLHEILFEREGYPDGIWYYEDMGFKNRPFMSPQMYCDLIFPSHKHTFDYAHSKGMPVIVHSCGFVEPLLGDMIKAGMDCFQTIEVKAGMDLLQIYQKYGDKIALMGGIDIRTLSTNDRSIIDKELESKIPIVKQGFGYIAHTDHSIPKTVHYDTFQYYLKRVLELGAY